VNDNSNVFVHVEDINWFADKHVGGSVTEEAQNIFIQEHKELLISQKPKPPIKIVPKITHVDSK
jgi:hypothetical protein